MINLVLNNAAAEVHFKTVKSLLERRIKNIISRNKISKKGKYLMLDPELKNYISSLLNETNLKELIVASPHSLRQIAALMKVRYPKFTSLRTNSNFILRNIFVDHGYDNSGFDKLEFIKNINIDTCPYCNRNYIYYLSKEKKLKPEIDHFYPKTLYPFLALSFYNLIPSCHTCNSPEAKGGNDPLEKHLINPYEIKPTDFRFSYDIKSIDAVNPLANKYSVSVEFINMIHSHMDIFKLREFYDQHSDHVLELVIKSKMQYSEKYRDSLTDYQGFTFGQQEIDRLILGNYSAEQELHKRPFAKLYQDIGRELGLIQSRQSHPE